MTVRRTARRAPAAPLAAAALWLALPALLAPPAAVAQQEAPHPEPQEQPAGDDPAAADDRLTFLESVTVAATLRPAPVGDIPGTASVIDAATIQGRMLEDLADLVKYEPGVYMENDVTRFGLNGINIRGTGGNRVLTQIDGVQTSEQFDFRLLGISQMGIDPDMLRSVEIVRGASSALYGSDALGGVLSLVTKDPDDLLRGDRFHAGAKTTWDGRANDLSGNVSLAGGNERVQGMFFGSVHRGDAFKTRGTVETEDDTRTAANPQSRRGVQILAKLTFTAAPGNRLRAAVEANETRVETDGFSQHGTLSTTSSDFFAGIRGVPMLPPGPTIRIDTADFDTVDTQQRWRLSLDQTLAARAGLDLVSWRVHGSRSDTSQLLEDARTVTTLFGGRPIAPPAPEQRLGTFDFDQRTIGGTAQGEKLLGGPGRGVALTFGGSYQRDRFDTLRDIETRFARPVPPGPAAGPGPIYPTKFFPASDVTEAGAYLQAEIETSRVSITPGVRYDRFATDADQHDAIYLATMSPAPVDFAAGALSPKLGAAVRVSDALTIHAQYASGFRAPPYSAVNNGYTNLAVGVRTLPNPDLRPETSNNVEVGFRSTFERVSIGVTGFSNRFDDFIALTTLPLAPGARLLEFQARNLDEVHIAGVEVRGEAHLGERVTLRGSFAAISGENVALDEPLEEIAPSDGAVGVQYLAGSGNWGSELSLRFTAGKHMADVGAQQFAPQPYTVADLVGFVSLAGPLTLRLGLLNLTNARYFEWWNVRGRRADDPVIDRYSSPGIGFIGSLAYDW